MNAEKAEAKKVAETFENDDDGLPEEPYAPSPKRAWMPGPACSSSLGEKRITAPASRPRSLTVKLESAVETEPTPGFPETWTPRKEWEWCEYIACTKSQSKEPAIRS